MTYTADEMMAVEAARRLDDDSVCFVGIGLPSLAANLARRTHAPGCVLVYESGSIGSKPGELPLSIGDGELAETADAVVTVPEMFSYWLQGGRIDVGFLGAAQIDRHANLNSTVIGDYDHPTVRLPGGGGAPEIALGVREVFVMLRQSPRAFVDELDFTTSLGDRVKVVVTDLGVLEPRDGELDAHAGPPGREAAAGTRGHRLGPARRGGRLRDRSAVGRGVARSAVTPYQRGCMSVDPYEGPVVLPDDPSFGPEVQIDYPGYRSTQWRAPKQPLVTLPEELHALDGPVFGEAMLNPLDSDLTRQHDGDPLGERIVVHGRVVDEDGRAVRGALVEVWQANAAGRYKHEVDQHPAPLDPNFSGAGRCLTDQDGRYRFVTVKPGSYPWGNHENAWRPAHIHFSVFGRLFTQRLVTQMYFPGDPLFAYDPIFNSVRDPHSRALLVSRFDIAETQPAWALAYEWDIVLGRGGRETTPVEETP